MRIDAADKLAGMLKKALHNWHFEVVSTDKGNATIAATSDDLQSSFLIASLPPTRGLTGDKTRTEIARLIASANPSLHSDGVNVEGRNDDFCFAATVQRGRVSIHIYCDDKAAYKIARLLSPKE